MPRITTQESRLSSLEVESLVVRYARALDALKITSNQIIALHFELCPMSIALVLAVIRLGLKVAFCPLREPSSVIKAWLADLDAKIIISSGNFDKQSYDQNQTKIYDIRQILTHKSSGKIINKSENFVSYIRTSGTTSMPKSAVINFRAHVNSATSVSNYFSFSQQQIWALSLPLYHVSGLSIIFRALVQDAEIYIAPDHESLVLALSTKAATHCSVVPAQVKRLLKENVDLSQIQALIVGGDSLAPADRDEALVRGWPLYESYGMCETASMIAVKKSYDQEAQTIILPHAEIKLAADYEICVKATSLFLGYYSDGELSQKLSPDGYFHTGDTATVQGLAQLELINRKNNRIISGGENIQAEEVERVLELHESVAECVVVPMPDKTMGARPVAFIKYKHSALSDQELYNFLAPRLATYKFPVRFINYPKDTPQSLKKPRRWLINYMSSSLS